MSQSIPLVSIESFILPTPNHRVKERLESSSLNSRNISSVGLNTVDLYSGKTISYRAVKKDVDFSDYYEATSAEFQNISKDGNASSLWSSLKQENDLHWVHSPSSDSEYLLDYEHQKVYRYSDHWGKVGSCEWALNDITTGWNVGVSFLKDFKALPSSRSEVLRSSFIEKLNQSIVNLEDIINRPDIKKTSSAEKALRNRLNSLVDYKETLTDWKVFNEKYNVDKQSKNIHDMGNKKDTSPKAANTSYADSVLQKFADMMIKRMSEMKDSNWTKGWMNGHSEAGLPRNALTGRLYTGFNPLMLAFHSTHEGYKTAMFLTAHQLYDMNEPLKDSTTGKIKTENLDKVMKIKPGENYFPVLYILHGYRDNKGNICDKNPSIFVHT